MTLEKQMLGQYIRDEPVPFERALLIASGVRTEEQVKRGISLVDELSHKFDTFTHQFSTEAQRRSLLSQIDSYSIMKDGNVNPTLAKFYRENITEEIDGYDQALAEFQTAYRIHRFLWDGRAGTIRREEMRPFIEYLNNQLAPGDQPVGSGLVLAILFTLLAQRAGLTVCTAIERLRGEDLSYLVGVQSADQTDFFNPSSPLTAVTSIANPRRGLGKVDPFIAEVYMNKARSTDGIDAQIEEVVKATTVDYDHRPAWILKAEYNADKGDYGEAMSDYQRALEIEETADTFHDLAVVCLKARDFDSARTYGNKAVEGDNNQSAYHITLGEVYAAQEEWALAAIAYKDAVALNQESLVARVGLIETYLSAKKADHALNAAMGAIESGIEDSTVYELAATACGALGNSELAREFRERASKLIE